MPDYVKFPLVLLIVTVISASTLAYINHIAEPRIKAQEQKRELAGERVVFPGQWAATEKAAEVSGGSTGKKRTIKYKEIHRDGTLAGYLVKGEAPGYSSTIEVLVGVGTDVTVTGVKVLFQQETPGLGTRIVAIESDKTWLSMLGLEAPPPSEEGAGPRLPAFTRFQFIEDKETREPRWLGVEDLWLTTDKPETGKVEAITGATISSRAVTEAVRKALVDLRLALEVQDGGERTSRQGE